MHNGAIIMFNVFMSMAFRKSHIHQAAIFNGKTCKTKGRPRGWLHSIHFQVQSFVSTR
jgi:hypothetical protein